MAAKQIQNFAHTIRVRGSYLTQKAATYTLQRFVRGCFGRQQALNRLAAITHCQALARGWGFRKRLYMWHKRSTQIQRHVRGLLGRVETRRRWHAVGILTRACYHKLVWDGDYAEIKFKMRVGAMMRALAVSIAEKEMRQIKWEQRQQERRWQKQQSALVSVVNRARGLGLVLKKGDAARFKAAGLFSSPVRADRRASLLPETEDDDIWGMDEDEWEIIGLERGLVSACQDYITQFYYWCKFKAEQNVVEQQIYQDAMRISKQHIAGLVQKIEAPPMQSLTP